MITFSQSKLHEAQRVLSELGFTQQHQRIFHYFVTEEELVYQCVLGFEEAGEDLFEVNLSVMRRPSSKNKKAIMLEQVRVIDIDEAPTVLQDILQEAENQLESLD